LKVAALRQKGAKEKKRSVLMGGEKRTPHPKNNRASESGRRRGKDWGTNSLMPLGRKTRKDGY